MENSINKFNHLYLSKEETQNIKGGYANFCEWYLGLCDGDETASQISKALNKMMRYDNDYDFSTASESVKKAAYNKMKKYL